MRKLLIALVLVAGAANAYDYNNPVPTAGSPEAAAAAVSGVDDLLGDLSAGKNSTTRRQQDNQKRQEQHQREIDARIKAENDWLLKVSNEVIGP
ncbi:hypothetical protein DW203_18665 [Citrobacter portucalensis]|uniref:hypothetical protein n=1 Tax=Citrobacter portucalensis TaxID=1639133 RepID=UPI000E47D338|nr:hypothetical protein [Citrobacter portucalensis]RHH45607.1 hypothetical protein DW203_18665 [Citrobacter portucalensis]